MANLIIGHTTETSTRIWIRGEKNFSVAQISVKNEEGTEQPRPKSLNLDPGTDYIKIVQLDGLSPNTPYTISASFTGTPGWWNNRDESFQVQGEFRTFPCPKNDHSDPFSFLLGSCNLSIFTINSFLALSLGLLGRLAMTRSLKRPLNKWDMDFPEENVNCGYLVLIKLAKTFPRIFGWLSDKAIKWGVVFVSGATKGKQPGKPMLKSPFLKLCALFDSSLIHIRVMRHMKKMPSVGDTIIGSKSRATGVLAFSPVLEKEGQGEKEVVGKLVMTHVCGDFQPEECLRVDGEAIAITTSSAERGEPHYKKPRFIIHAGDQIYFDFPYRRRRPELKEYWRSYREAWSEDESLRYFLAQYPHYMTLDDHEIYDQFARDRPSPRADQNLESHHYLEPAEKAYREYVHVRQPDTFGTNILHYTFQYGAVHYFVLNTRTYRHMGNKQMIEDEQMKCFLEWLRAHKDDLKFVVSSVPFVAEVRSRSVKNDHESAADNEWTSKPKSQNNLSEDRKFEKNDDKWSSDFSWDQREKIIKFVYCQQIKRLVFLVGDMHCTYHATMQVGQGTKYECLTIHELAGGPFHQLQMAREDQFGSLTERTFKIQNKKIAMSTSTSSKIENENRWKISFGSGEYKPCVGHILVGQNSEATGVLGEPPILEEGTWNGKNASGSLLLNQVHGTFRDGEPLKIKEDEIPYKTQLDRFYSGANAAMHVTVAYPSRRRVDLKLSKPEPEIVWKVIRTMTESEPINPGELPPDTPAMSGRIRFMECVHAQ